MIGSRGRLAVAGISILLVVSACGGKSAPSAGSASPTASLQITMPAPTSALDKVTWAVYREVGTLDPIFAFDYPENTAVAAMCETLIRQQPDGSTVPGLASSIDTSDPTKIVFTLRDGVTFWDGHPLTSADVVNSLERQIDPKNGGYYGAVFQNVKSIEATSNNVVTINLKQPDYLLLGELSSTPGFITEKAYTNNQGTGTYGTHDGGVMCTGAFKYKAWKTGGALQMVRNDNYWDTSAPQMVKELDIVGAPDEANLTESLKTGEIDATYAGAMSTLDELKAASNLNVLTGPSYATSDLILNKPSGTLGNPLVRQALSLAIDRQGLIDAVWRGSATMPHAIAGPGTFGYAKDTYQAAYDALPVMNTDIEKAKSLIKQAGAEGKSIVLGTSSEIAALQTEADAVKSAAEEIGLKATEKSVSAAQYLDFFTPNSKIAQQVDGFFTINYPDYADPLALYAPIPYPGGFNNYFSYNNPQVVSLLQKAQQEPDPTKRAEDVSQAQIQITKDLPWIPLAIPYTTLIINKRVTGAPVSFQYMFGPWAAGLGGTG
jgi:peptide/nickel transport system substrate-binding protein